MKRIIALIVAAAAMALVAAGSASADVPRYQPTATLAVSLTDAQPGNVHTYTITWADPCGTTGAFTGIGYGSTTDLGKYVNETISGTLVGDHLTFTAVYTDFIQGYTWTYDGPLAGPVALGGAATGYHATATVESINTYKNHGQYVKVTGGDDAAHSCIGMPIVSVPFEWSASGTVSATSGAGTDVTLPKPGTYRIDVLGTWVNTPYGQVDAEYAQFEGAWYDGFDHLSVGWMLGPDFGDLQVNGQFVDWGAYNAAHAYTHAFAFTGTTLNLAIFDGQNGVQMPWYGDNTGFLGYTVTYVGP
jgi:hypothetical protein